MNITIETTSAGLTLISSGFFMTIGDEPIRMSVIISGDKTITVVLYFHPEFHPGGRCLERKISDDETIDEWHIYENPAGESALTGSPVSIMGYEGTGGEAKLICLQLHSTRLPNDGPVKVDYAWWVGADATDLKQ
jgi:hypothetical protein